MFYYAVIEADPNGQYATGAWFPDLIGCFSAADEEEDILKNCIEAVSLWAEHSSSPLPNPKTINEIMDIEQVKEDLATGSFLLAVPFVKKNETPVRINISLRQEVVDAIDAVAKQRKTTRSGFIAEAAMKEIYAC